MKKKEEEKKRRKKIEGVKEREKNRILLDEIMRQYGYNVRGKLKRKWIAKSLWICFFNDMKSV